MAGSSMITISGISDKYDGPENVGVTAGDETAAAAEKAAEKGYGGSSSSPIWEHQESRFCPEEIIEKSLLVKNPSPCFLRPFSNSASWYIRLMLGDITPDRCLTKSYASVSPIPRARIT